MSSIKTKFLTFTILIVVLSMLVIGAVASIFCWTTLKIQYSVNMLKTTEAMCYNLDIDFMAVEHMGGALSEIAFADLPSDPMELATSTEIMDEYIEKQVSYMKNVSQNYSGQYAFFMRFNPEYFGSMDGYYVKKINNNQYKRLQKVDFSGFDSSSDEVRWFYEPVNAAKALWLFNYTDPNDGHISTSYNTPIFKNGVAIAVLGIEVEGEALFSDMSEIDEFDTGIAMLVSEEGDLVKFIDYTDSLTNESASDVSNQIMDYIADKNKNDVKELQMDVTIENKGYLVQAMRMGNGMTLINLISKTEIFSSIYYLMFELLVMALATGIIASVIAIMNIRKIIRPMENLTSAAEQIANGNFDVRVEENGDKEINILARAINRATVELQEMMEYHRKLAYIDVLTGLKNRRAYFEDGADITKRLVLKNIKDLTVIYMDVNNLKQVNDTMGHDDGDMLIIDASTIIKATFGDRTYRIGGDEFVALILEENEEKIEERITTFNNRVEKINLKKKRYGELSIAIGVTKNEDGETFAAVVDRAEELMYKNKNEVKCHR